MEGTAESARFFLTEDLQEARKMLQDRQVEWVFVCDWDRLGQDFASLLELGIPQRSMGSDFGSRVRTRSAVSGSIGSKWGGEIVPIC